VESPHALPARANAAGKALNRIGFLKNVIDRLVTLRLWSAAGKSHTLHGMTTLREGLGRAVRRLRQAQGISQEALAAKCRIHRTYMTDLERGQRNVSIDIIEKVVRGLGVDAGVLFAEAEKERRGRRA
jgi:ribosome-binding protein aMBF1 (putative translation factor)